MPSFHRKFYYKASQEMGLSHGNMKITSHRHNEEFMDAQASLMQLESPQKFNCS